MHPHWAAHTWVTTRHCHCRRTWVISGGERPTARRKDSLREDACPVYPCECSLRPHVFPSKELSEQVTYTLHAPPTCCLSLSCKGRRPSVG